MGTCVDHKAQTCWFFIGLMILILCFMYTIFCKFFGKSWLSAPPLCIPDLKINSQPQALSLQFTQYSKVPHKLVHVSLRGNISTHHTPHTHTLSKLFDLSVWFSPSSSQQIYWSTLILQGTLYILKWMLTSQETINCLTINFTEMSIYIKGLTAP